MRCSLISTKEKLFRWFYRVRTKKSVKLFPSFRCVCSFQKLTFPCPWHTRKFSVLFSITSFQGKLFIVTLLKRERPSRGLVTSIVQHILSFFTYFLYAHIYCCRLTKISLNLIIGCGHPVRSVRALFSLKYSATLCYRWKSITLYKFQLSRCGMSTNIIIQLWMQIRPQWLLLI